MYVYVLIIYVYVATQDCKNQFFLELPENKQQNGQR